jgi:hypothetical protein
MLVGDYGRIQNVQGLSEEQRQRINDCMLGAVYCWCKNRKDEWFSVQSLFGSDWRGLVIQELYEREGGDENHDAAFEEAPKSAGRLLKRALNDDDVCRFETRKNFNNREYRFVDRNRGG